MEELTETTTTTERKIRKCIRAETSEAAIKRAVAYARVSSDRDEAGHSLEAQIKYYEDYISNHNGWVLAGTYVDDGISGTKVNRPAFQDMINACRKGEVDIIITKSITRFARNTVVLLETLRELKSLGVNVIFEKEHIETASTTGELMLTILGTFAEEEARSASLNQLWRIKRMFENGEVTPTRMLGYCTKDKALEVIPEEAEVVRKIYHYYLSGMGIPNIIHELDKAQIYTIHGNKYDKRVIRKILMNEKYTGDLILQKSYTEDFRTKRTIANNGEKPKYYVTDAHEAIISKEDWVAVQAERARRRSLAPTKSLEGFKSGPYLFTRFIICNNCKMHYIRKKRNGKIIWTCKTYSEDGKEACPNSAIPEPILIAKTLEAIHLVSPTADCTNLTRELIESYITSITVPENRKLTFHMKAGIDIALEWQHPSRRESWTDEMKAKAREKALLNIKRKEESHE